MDDLLTYHARMNDPDHADTPNAAIDWSRVDWVLLDMDGTLLDLSYDNYFWQELVPRRYAQARGLSLDHARDVLAPRFAEVRHTLPWYCTRYWSDLTGLDMAAMKHEVRHRIGVLPGVERFLHAANTTGRRVWLATNAHADSWQLKLDCTGIGGHFERVICSHDFGHPKEDLRFWEALHERQPFDPARTLFVDDSMPVLSAAQAFGIAQVIGIRKPDSQMPERPLPAFASVRTLADLNLPG
jgi:putative hydrolase of the HAD superfamily